MPGSEGPPTPGSWRSRYPDFPKRSREPSGAGRLECHTPGMDENTYSRLGATAVALVTELLHDMLHHGREGDPTSPFNEIIRQSEDPVALAGALAGLTVALLRQLDELRPGSAAEFLEKAGLMVRKIDPPA